MSNVNVSPNMNLPVPVVGVDPGPDWANNTVACFGAVDSHNHSPGQGVPVTPDGISISADLPFNGNNATTLRSARFLPQLSPLALASDLGCLYESGVDLYYNDGNGNQVRITQSGSVTGAAGTITGLPSGTASASYAGGTFTFQSATNTPASMAVGPLVIGAATTSPKTVTFGTSASQPANYGLTLPLAAPAVNQVQVSDGSGNLAWLTVVSGTFTPTISFINIGGNDLTFTITSNAGYYTRFGSVVQVQVFATYTVSAWTSGSTFYQAGSTIPIATAALVPVGTITNALQNLQNPAPVPTTNLGTTVVQESLALSGGPPPLLYNANQFGRISFTYMYQLS